MTRNNQKLIKIWIKLSVIAVAFLLSISIPIIAQEPVLVTKSKITENIDGKTFYLHFVKEGETIYSIARAYGVDVNTIFVHNASAQEGIRTGQLIKIPRIEIEERIGNKIQTADSTNYYFHIVQKGETLFGLSQKYSVAIDRIKEINPELGDYPRTGQALRIPKNTGPINVQSPDDNFIRHTVKQGETLYSLAKEYNVTIGQIKNANPEIVEAIKTGQTLLIPKTDEPELPEAEPETSGEESYREHIVKAGETLYSIARQYAIETDRLKDFNPGLTEVIFEGQLIRIPYPEDQRDYIMHHSFTKERIESIAYKYGVDKKEIEDLNPGVSKKVKPGEIVKIPVDRSEYWIPDTIHREIIKPEDLEPSPCADHREGKGRIMNVALMVPFFLENYDSTLLSESDFFELRNMHSFRFIQFYEGMLLAADSMKQRGMNLNLFVYDVDNDVQKTRRLLARSELSSMDLIIGPFYSASFSEAEKFAKTFNIKIINPLSTRKDILKDNPFVFKITPTYSSQPRIISSYVLKKFRESNIIVIRHNKYQHATEAQAIIEAINSARSQGCYFNNAWIMKNIEVFKNHDLVYSENKPVRYSTLKEHPGDSLYFSNSVKEIIYSSDSLPGLRLNMSYVRHNVVIIITEDKVFAQEVMSRLNKMSRNQRITLIGLPEWEKFEDLETAYKMNLDFHTMSPVLIDYRDPRTIDFIRKFRRMSGNEPVVDFFAYTGFDIGWYFLNALFRYGAHFEECLDDYKPFLIHSSFNFINSGDDGYENQYWNIVRFRDFEKVNAWRSY